MSLRHERLHSSEVVAVTDVRCRPRDSCCGPEEATTTNNIVVPRRGCFVRHVGRRSTVADANTVLFFQRDEGYHVSHPAPGGDDCTSFSFAPAIVAEAFSAFDRSVTDRPGEPFGTTRALCDGGAFLAMQRLRAMARRVRANGDGSPSLAVDEAALGLLETIARSSAPAGRRCHRPARADTVRCHRELVENTRVVLCERMCESPTLPELARRVHSSPFHLARIFRRMTGLSLHQYLTRLRLRAAMERLAEGASDLTAVALGLGFASHSHFSSAFRREFALPPSVFRRELALASSAFRRIPLADDDCERARN